MGVLQKETGRRLLQDLHRVQNLMDLLHSSELACALAQIAAPCALLLVRLAHQVQMDPMACLPPTLTELRRPMCDRRALLKRR